MRFFEAVLLCGMVIGCGGATDIDSGGPVDASLDVRSDARSTVPRDAAIDVVPDANPTRCGGDTPNPISCGPDEYCQFAPRDTCGGADGPGICTPRPNACPDDCPGVCACDNRFFCNACNARQAGIDVRPGDDCQ